MPGKLGRKDHEVREPVAGDVTEADAALRVDVLTGDPPAEPVETVPSTSRAISCLTSGFPLPSSGVSI